MNNQIFQGDVNKHAGGINLLRIQDFFVRNHELCFEFNTFSVEIMIYASNSTDAIFSKMDKQKSVFGKHLSKNELPELSARQQRAKRYALSDLNH